MLNISIIYPMATLVFFTFIIMTLMIGFRVRSVLNKTLPPEYFKLNNGAKVPDYIVAITQNYSNLLEFPIIFYVVCTLALVLNQVNESLIMLSWLYVGLRFIHSIIHTTYNNIEHRLFVYYASCIIVIVMWAKLLLLISATV